MKAKYAANRAPKNTYHVFMPEVAPDGEHFDTRHESSNWADSLQLIASDIGPRDGDVVTEYGKTGRVGVVKNGKVRWN